MYGQDYYMKLALSLEDSFALLRAKQNEEMASKNVIYNCPRCSDKYFATENYLREHYKKKHPEIKLKPPTRDLAMNPETYKYHEVLSNQKKMIHTLERKCNSLSNQLKNMSNFQSYDKEFDKLEGRINNILNKTDRMLKNEDHKEDHDYRKRAIKEDSESYDDKDTRKEEKSASDHGYS